jgi:hypothetical protein
VFLGGRRTVEGVFGRSADSGTSVYADNGEEKRRITGFCNGERLTGQKLRGTRRRVEDRGLDFQREPGNGGEEARIAEGGEGFWRGFPMGSGQW